MTKIVLMLLVGLEFIAACSPQIETRTNSQDGRVMVRVPAGDFKMGISAAQIQKLVEQHHAAANGFDYETPEHTVNLGEFWIDRDPVTNAAYKKFLDANPAHPAPDIDLPQLKGWSWNADTRSLPPGRENLPVVLVTWSDANAYCQWAGGRLPTEAEWEKAARGTDGRLYPWGNEWDKNKTAYGEQGASDAVGVGTVAGGASPYGANDMVGDVWQWTSSLMMSYPYQANDGREDPSKTGERVTRGGMYAFGPAVSRTNVRNKFAPEDKAISVGFRCAHA